METVFFIYSRKDLGNPVGYVPTLEMALIILNKYPEQYVYSEQSIVNLDAELPQLNVEEF